MLLLTDICERESDRMTGLNYIKIWNASMLQTNDVRDAMLAGLQKRKATFSKL